MSQKCPKGSIFRDGYTRKAYTRANGTRVKSTKVEGGCILKRGLGDVKRSVWELEQREKKAQRATSAKKHFGKNVPKCKKGEILREGSYVEDYTRKAYTRADGRDVKKAVIKGHFRPPVCITDVGKPGKGKELIGPLKKGTLTKYGYHASNTEKSRHESLNKFIKENVLKEGLEFNSALTAYRKLIAVSTLQKNTNPKISKTMRADAEWIKKKYNI